MARVFLVALKSLPLHVPALFSTDKREYLIRFLSSIHGIHIDFRIANFRVGQVEDADSDTMNIEMFDDATSDTQASSQSQVMEVADSDTTANDDQSEACDTDEENGESRCVSHIVLLLFFTDANLSAE